MEATLEQRVAQLEQRETEREKKLDRIEKKVDSLLFATVPSAIGLVAALIKYLAS